MLFNCKSWTQYSRSLAFLIQCFSVQRNYPFWSEEASQSEVRDNSFLGWRENLLGPNYFHPKHPSLFDPVVLTHIGKCYLGIDLSENITVVVFWPVVEMLSVESESVL